MTCQFWVIIGNSNFNFTSLDWLIIDNCITCLHTDDQKQLVEVLEFNTSHICDLTWAYIRRRIAMAKRAHREKHEKQVVRCYCTVLTHLEAWVLALRSARDFYLSILCLATQCKCSSVSTYLTYLSPECSWCVNIPPCHRFGQSSTIAPCLW